MPHLRLRRDPRTPRSVARGFTLVELLVVLAIIGTLATLVAPDVLRHVGTSKATAARSQIEMLGAALETYRLDNDGYPSTAQGLDALRRRPASAPRQWRGPYLPKDVPLDPWGRPYHFRSPGVANPRGYDLASFGRDGRAGGTGDDADLLSWK